MQKNMFIIFWRFLEILNTYRCPAFQAVILKNHKLTKKLLQMCKQYLISAMFYVKV